MQRELRIACLVAMAGVVAACGGRDVQQSSPATAAPTTMAELKAVATYRGDAARTGVMPGPGPSGQPELAWQLQADGSIGSSPAVADGTVFVASEEGTVHAVELVTGAPRWEIAVGAELGATTPLLLDGLVIVGDRGGTVHALDQATGAERWRTPVNGPVGGAAAAARGLIVLATEAETAYGLEPETGRIRWQATLPGAVTRSIAATDDLVYCPLSDGLVVALHATDGTPAWQARVATGGDGGTPTVAGGRVFAAAGLDSDDRSTRAIVALDAADGSERWRRSSPSGEVMYTPAVVGGRAFIVAEDGSVVAVDAATGEVGWTATAGEPIDALPAVWASNLYVGATRGSLLALDTASGAISWRVAIQGVPYAPIVIGGFVLVGTNIGALYAFSDPAR